MKMTDESALLAQARAVLARYADDDAQSIVNRIDARLAADQQKGGGKAVPEWWPRFVANAAASLDKRGDRKMAARMMVLHSAMTATTGAEHDLWKTGEVGAPSSIVDRNGDVALALCKVCGQGEGDIEPTCPCPQPSIPAPAQHAPAFQRWSMAKGSDGARWSVYMDHDPCGEWVKWVEVQQHFFGMALAQQPAVVGDGFAPDVGEILPDGWERDCQGKEDYDAGLLQMSCRYYPANYRSDGRPSVRASVYWGDGIRCCKNLVEKDIAADSEAEVKAMAEQWAREQIAVLSAALTPAATPGDGGAQ